MGRIIKNNVFENTLSLGRWLRCGIQFNVQFKGVAM